MTKTADVRPDVEKVMRQAVACNTCFETLPLSRPTVAKAQPRWIGADYWASSPRVVIVMLNPGSGAARHDSGDVRLNRLLGHYASDGCTLQEIFLHQREDMHNWGRGRFLKFYSSHLGLRLDRIAFLNVAWCATKGNLYPDDMLSLCFSRHTLPMMRLLGPTLVMLSGSNTHRFADAICAALPPVRVERTLHYAHREGAVAEQAEILRLKAVIQSLEPSPHC